MQLSHQVLNNYQTIKKAEKANSTSLIAELQCAKCASGAPRVRKFGKPMHKKIGLSSEPTPASAYRLSGRGGGATRQPARGEENAISIISHRTLRLTSACIFDLEHPCYCQLTAVKTRYLLTGITWLYCGLRCTAYFSSESRAQILLFCLG